MVFVLGIAGSGKTTLTQTFVSWLQERGLDARAVNLDPGARTLPYDPAFDVREIVTVDELMEERGLGPNGAILEAVEIMVNRRSELVGALDRVGADYLVVDTPGQTEAFALRPAGRAIVSSVASRFRTSAMFLGEVTEDYNLEDALTAALLAKVVELKLDVGVVPVLNKVDQAKGEELRSLWISVMRGDLEAVEVREGGVATDALLDLIQAVRSFGTPTRVALVSARAGTGLEELFDMLVEVWCACGDLT